MALSQGDREGRGVGGESEREQGVERGSSALVDGYSPLCHSLWSRAYRPWTSQVPGAQEAVWEPKEPSQGSQGLCVKHAPEHLPL